MAMTRARSKSWGSRKVAVPPDGQIRLSQMITTFGPGAMVDLVDQAVVVGGLDFWSYDARGMKQVADPRLRDALAERFQAVGRELSDEHSFREPPAGDDRDPSRASGVQVLEFPQWFVCQNPRCHALARSDGLERKRGRYVHACERRASSDCVPVRFVGACKNGHLEDFPWIFYAHQDRGRCAAPSLRLVEGRSGDFSEIQVRCACGAAKPLSHAVAPDANPLCRGERPWLGPDGREGCQERLRLLVRTASNAYFAQVVSALSIPETGREVEAAVRSQWAVLKAATPATLPAFRTIPAVAVAIDGVSDDEVLAAVRALHDDLAAERLPLRSAEYLQLSSAKTEAPGDLPGPDDRFFARRMPVDGETPLSGVGVVLAHKLREVRAQVGFTRLEAATPDLQGEYDLGVHQAMLGLTTNWLPATEIQGEGLFVQLDEDAVRSWEQRPQVQARGRDLLDGYRRWAAPADDYPPFPGVRFYMLHSLSHLLISAISLTCGYAASAIRERIYCDGADAAVPMAAVLLSTGSAGTEGTLGGLVEQGRHLTSHLRRAFDLGSLCSNDPVCAGHTPRGDLAERYLEGSACHGCLFLAECSCERFNRYLDRALVVPAIGHEPELALFSRRP